MRAGELRHRIVIQQNTPTQDAYGQPIASWSTYVTRWAAVVPQRANREDTIGAEMVATTGVVIRLRYWTDHGITPLMRVSWDSRFFDVNGVQETDGARRELQLLCTEVQE